MTKPDFRPAVPRSARDPRLAALHAATLVVAVVSGICALVALAAGSPLQFGVALALFGAGWIASDFIERAVGCGQQRPARQRAAVARPVPPYRSTRVVYAGRHEHFSRPAPSVVREMAA
ncbi:hypothetical protein A5674_26795 [Mycobacterium malmoense]|uniref:hypothetical protein n=1 Tax=Mycobacterium malmoense TaxID=1780 RepID=UPI00080B1AAF|nr:hypothetical protein [Mycobacterium malmoense]OCB22112.1 hypothetical protein A5674_26795 [Mycobacterium malmoense]